MISDKTIKVELEDYLMYDKLGSLAIGYAISIDRLVNHAIRRLVNDVEFVQELRLERTKTAPRQDEQT